MSCPTPPILPSTASGSTMPAVSICSSSRAAPVTDTSRSSSRAPHSTVTSRSSRSPRPRAATTWPPFPSSARSTRCRATGSPSARAPSAPSRERCALIIHGDGKRTAARRVLEATTSNPTGPRRSSTAAAVPKFGSMKPLTRAVRRRSPGSTRAKRIRRSRMIRRSTASRLGALGGSALMLAALGAPAAAQDVQTDGWGDIGDVTIRIAAENASVDTLTALAEAFMARVPQRHHRDRVQGLGQLHVATVLNVADLPDAPDIIFGNQGYVDGWRPRRRRADRQPRALLRGLRLGRLVRRGRQGPVPLHRGRRPSARDPAGASPSRPTSWASSTTSTSWRAWASRSRPPSPSSKRRWRRPQTPASCLQAR